MTGIYDAMELEEFYKTYGRKYTEWSKHQQLQDAEFFIHNIIGFKNMTRTQREWLHMFEKSKRTSIMCFRSGGKTELVLNYMAWKIALNPGFQVMLASYNKDMANMLTYRLRSIFQAVPILETMIPSNKSTLWSQAKMEFVNGALVVATPYLKTRSMHVDMVYHDEIGEYTNHQAWQDATFPVVRAKNGRILCTGTPTSKTDLLHKLMENEAWTSGKYPALWDEDHSSKETLWTERYPDIPWQDVRKEAGNLTWSREYMLVPLGAGDQLFPQTLIDQAYEPTVAFSFDIKKRLQYFIGIDFALSAEVGADYTVICVLEKHDDELLLVHAERRRAMPFQEQKKLIKNINDIFRPVRILIDEGTFGKTFLQDMRNMNMNVQGFRFTQQSKQELIEVLQASFSNRKLRLPYDKSNPETRKFTETLSDELANFGVVVVDGAVKYEGVGKHDDTVMGLGLAVMAARGFQNMNNPLIMTGKSLKRRFNSPFILR